MRRLVLPGCGDLRRLSTVAASPKVDLNGRPCPGLARPSTPSRDTAFTVMVGPRSVVWRPAGLVGSRAGSGLTRILPVGQRSDLHRLCGPLPPEDLRRDLIGAWLRPKRSVSIGGPSVGGIRRKDEANDGDWGGHGKELARGRGVCGHWAAHRRSRDQSQRGWSPCGDLVGQGAVHRAGVGNQGLQACLPSSSRSGVVDSSGIRAGGYPATPAALGGTPAGRPAQAPQQ